jgi:hypothetical protein
MNDVLTWPVGRQLDVCHRRTIQRAHPCGPVLVYVLASGLGGLISGILLGTLGRILEWGGLTRAAVATAVAISALAIQGELKGRVSPLPESRRQVPRRWIAWRRKSATAAAYGFVLGMGAFTHLQHAALYVLAVLVVLAPSVTTAALLGAAYGTTRGSVVLVTWIGDRRGHRLRWSALSVARAAVERVLATTAIVALVLGIIQHQGGLF